MTTSASLAPGAICTSAPACWVIVMSAFSVTAVWPVRENGPAGSTVGVVLIVTDRLPCATAQAASVTAWFMHDRAGAGVDHDLGRRRRAA